MFQLSAIAMRGWPGFRTGNLLLRVTGWFKGVCVRYASFVAIEYWSCALGAVVEMSGLATPGLLRDMGQTKKAEHEGSGGLRHLSCMT